LDYDDVETMFTNDIHWATVKFASLVFLQRPFTDDHLKACDLVKNCQVPLWLDFDDDLFGVGPENPCHGIYGNKKIQENLTKMCAMADVITVSTKAIEEKLIKLNKNTIIVPNALDEYALEYWKPRRKREPIVLWRGGGSHQADLMFYTKEIISAQNRIGKRWAFQFLGPNPFWLTGAMSDTHTFISPQIGIIDYHKMIHELCPGIMMVPLAPSPFNRAKSNCVWLEATFAGAVSVAPDIPEFQQPGILNYSSAEDFEEKLVGLAQGAYEHEKMWKESWKIIEDKFLLGQTNRIRKGIIEAIHSRPRGIQFGGPRSLAPVGQPEGMGLG